jgi:hypothetical protein
MRGTKQVQEELLVEVTTKTEEWTQEIEVQETERKAALESIESQRKCLDSSRLETVRFKQNELRRKFQERKRLLEIRRQKIAQWKTQITIKHQSAMDSCSRAQRARDAIEKVRLGEECARLKEEVTTMTTEVNIEYSKIEEEEKTFTSEESVEISRTETSSTTEESEETTK